MCQRYCQNHGHFNPRSHRRERHAWQSMMKELQEFQPTLPPKGATLANKIVYFTLPISTHAPTEGSDHTLLSHDPPPTDFNPRSHRRERRLQEIRVSSLIHISTHAPTEGSDTSLFSKNSVPAYFNPRSHRRERRGRTHPSQRSPSDFNPRSHRRERQPEKL